MTIDTGASPPGNGVIIHFSSEDLRRIIMYSAQELGRRNMESAAYVLNVLMTDAETAEED